MLALKKLSLQTLLCFLSFALKLKYKLLRPYIEGLIIQARFLYRQSDLFKERLYYFGLETAEKLFEKDAVFFFNKAKKEPLPIRLRIFIDATLNRKQRPYY